MNSYACKRYADLQPSRTYKSSFGLGLPDDSIDPILSPRYFMWHNTRGNSDRAGQLQCSLKRHVIQKRTGYVKLGLAHRVRLRKIGCMDIDPIDNRYLLCGSNKGEMSIVDLEMPITIGERAVQHTTNPCLTALTPNGCVVGCCQWHPKNLEIFISACSSNNVKLWDANRGIVVNQWMVGETLRDMHWCDPVVGNPLIAVAALSPKFVFIDPRVASALPQRIEDPMQSLVAAVRWSPEDGNILSSASTGGQITIWDLRNTAKRLISVESPYKYALQLRYSPDGLHLISHSPGFGIAAWRAHTMKLINSIPINSKASDVALLTGFDVASENGVLRSFVPAYNNIHIVGLENIRNLWEAILTHIYPVSACVYRRNYHQLFVCSIHDSEIRMWCPIMDECIPACWLEMLEESPDSNDGSDSTEDSESSDLNS